jgi:3-hydroxyacyl-[acyl-carrier-protein] dehydratase
MTAHPSDLVMAGTPHRYPMLLLDRLDAPSGPRRGTAWKAVSAGETHGGGGAGTDGLAPTLLVDALGQLAIAVLCAEAGQAQPVFYLGSIEAMEFGAPARAGDLVRMDAKIERTFRGSSRVSVSARVEERVIARGLMVLSSGAGGGAAHAPARTDEAGA